MASFDPISALLGGALIGLASALLMMLTGRIAGISGIFGGCLTLVADDKVWRFAFIVGLILTPVTSGLLGYPSADAIYASKLGDDRDRRAGGPNDRTVLKGLRRPNALEIADTKWQNIMT